MDVVAIRKAIADSVRHLVPSAKHFRPETYQNSPAFWVEPVQIERSAMGRDRWLLVLDGTLYTASGWDRSKQERADHLVTDTWGAIEADRTLGGLIQSLEVESVQYLNDAEMGAPLGAVYRINVEA